ncbi:hypothetical protein [Chryseobacterium sp. M5A1_1a]
MENKTYTEAELISFGKYLVSKGREDSITGDDKGKRKCSPIDKKREVYDADLENWKIKKDGSA